VSALVFDGSKTSQANVPEKYGAGGRWKIAVPAPIPL